MKRWLDSPRAAWCLGVVLPVAMVVLDPAVFRSSVVEVGPPILGRLKAFGYSAIVLGTAVMALAISVPAARKALGGALAAGSLFSFALGVAILPFSVVGILFFGVGLLGFSPFLTGVIFGWRAFRSYQEAEGSSRLLPTVAGFALFFLVPVGLQSLVSSEYQVAIHEIVSRDPDGVHRGVGRLKRWRLVIDSDQMISVWSAQEQAESKKRVATAYRRVFGGSIAERAGQFVD